MSRKNLFNNIATLFSSNVLVQILKLARGFILARALGPELMGIWATLFIYLMYGENLHFGVYNSLTRNIPILRGAGDKNIYICRHINCAFSFTIIVSVLAGLAMTAISTLSSSVSYMRIGLFFLIVLMITQQWIVFFKFLFTAKDDFKLYSKCQTLGSILSFCSILLVVPFKFYGLLWGLVISDILYCCFLFYVSKYRFSWVFDKKILLSMAKTGFPIYCVGLIFVVLMSLNRFIISDMLGPTALGYFSIAFMVFSLIYFFPESIRYVFYIRMGEKYGEHKRDRKKLKKYVVDVTAILSFIMPLVVFLAIMGTRLFVPMLLPKYVPGVTPTIIYSIGIIFLGLASISINFLNIILKQKILFLGQAFIVLFNFFLAFFFVKKGMGLESVAAASTIAYFLYFVAFFTIALKIIGSHPLSIAKNLLTVIMPSALLMVVYLFLRSIMQAYAMYSIDDNLRECLVSAMSILIYLTVIILFFKNTIKNLFIQQIKGT